MEKVCKMDTAIKVTYEKPDTFPAVVSSLAFKYFEMDEMGDMCIPDVSTGEFPDELVEG